MGNQIEFDFSKLKGLIIEKYGSQAAFASALGISTNHMSMLLRNKARFTTKMIDKCYELLDISEDQIGMVFFKVKVQES